MTVRVSKRVMNDLSNAVLREQNSQSCKPIPSIAIYILIVLFFIGFSVSIFILIVVHNVAFFLSFLSLCALIISFIAWNRLNWKHKAAVFWFLRSFPDSNLATAREGQLVKITGLASCGSVSLESSYERAARCIYVSTLLYEYGGLRLKPMTANTSCFHWSLTYCEGHSLDTLFSYHSASFAIKHEAYMMAIASDHRFSTDFNITDRKSGIRATVKAGSGCKVIPLVVESKLVTTARRCRILSPHLRKWLQDRNLSAEARLLCLKEGYVQEGSFVTVIGVLHRNDDILTIVQPPELLSTGCLWQKLLLPVEVDGLVLGIPNTPSPIMNPDYRQQQEQ